MTNSRIYPGMLDNSIEYFQADDQMYFLQDGSVQKFSENEDHPNLQLIIDTDEALDSVLQAMGFKSRFAKQEKLAKCRFGGLDFEADFSSSTTSHDHIDCPMRGNCLGEHVVCKAPEINGEALTQKELEILRYCAGNKKNEAIAAELNMPYGSFVVEKTKIYKKYNFQTKQQSATTLMAKGLL